MCVECGWRVREHINCFSFTCPSCGAIGDYVDLRLCQVYVMGTTGLMDWKWLNCHFVCCVCVCEQLFECLCLFAEFNWFGYYGHKDNERVHSTLTAIHIFVADALIFTLLPLSSITFRPNFQHIAQQNTFTSFIRRWYFRKIKRIEAEKKLLLPENEHGAFLIRDSESRHNDYSLSGGWRRMHMNNWYRLAFQEHHTSTSLIDCARPLPIRKKNNNNANSRMPLAHVRTHTPRDRPHIPLPERVVYEYAGGLHVLLMPEYKMHIYRIEIIRYWLCVCVWTCVLICWLARRATSMIHRRNGVVFFSLCTCVIVRGTVEHRLQVSVRLTRVCLYVRMRVLFAQEWMRCTNGLGQPSGWANGSTTIDSSECRCWYCAPAHRHAGVLCGCVCECVCVLCKQWRLEFAWLVWTILISLFPATVRDGDTVKHYRIRQLDEGGFFIARRTTFRWVFLGHVNQLVPTTQSIRQQQKQNASRAGRALFQGFGRPVREPLQTMRSGNYRKAFWNAANVRERERAPSLDMICVNDIVFSCLRNQ